MTRTWKNSEPPLPIMEGAPVPPEWRVPALDWDNPPWNRWAFRNMRSVATTVDVPRGETVWEMPAAVSDFADLKVDLAEGPKTWAQILDDTYTDATLVWANGRIVAEGYWNGMTPATQHIIFSVSKSVASAVAGTLIGDGLLDVTAPVTEYLPELEATAWKGSTVQQVLDMTTGVLFDESYGDPDSHIYLVDVAANLKPPHPKTDPTKLRYSTWDLIMSLTEADAPHGERFDYRSIETDMLGYILERVGGAGLAELASTRLWAPMGAKRDGFFTVDRANYPLADGGFCITLRDMARFGRLLLEDGMRDGVPVVPKAWIDDIRSGPHGLANDYLQAMFPNGCYRNQFWIPDRGGRAHVSLGIHGQHIYVDPDRGIVAVKLSSWPVASGVPAHLADWLAGVEAIVREVS
ncbi:serine hydrolase domain-containing protein [Chachezhania antarctica]|uniref:serine hydrolase domain-containing protein n=1 Tax=Chachezhania antarctica TaxID=2340860 RepID=UPI000EB55DE0|nr:serine hydrolase [Chachezhania antarctica]